MELFEDPSGELSIEEVSSPEISSQFKPSQAAVPNYGYTDSVYWVRLFLDNQTSQVNEWTLEVDFSNTQYVDLYTPLPGGAGFDARRTGVLRPLSTRDLLYPRILFVLNLPPQEQQVYYVRFQSGASMTLGLTLWAKNAFWVVAGRDLMLHWLFFGGLFALLVYHLFLLYTLREASYLYFVLVLTGLLAVLTDLDGYLGAYIFPNIYQVKTIYLPLAVSFLYVSILLFSSEFLQLKTRFPKLYWINVACMVIWVVLVFLVPFTDYRVISTLMTPWQMITLGVSLFVGIAAWRSGFQPVRFFMLAWLSMTASLLLFVMVRQGIAPSNFFTENIYQLGMIVMAVCWSLALADRINLMKAETEAANRSLQNSENRLSQILEGMPLGVVVYGMDQKPKYLNQRSIEILGNPAQGIRPSVEAGRTVAQAVNYFSFRLSGTSDKYPLERLPVYRALHGEPAFQDDIVAVLGDRLVPIEIWANPVKDSAGNVDSVVVAFQDITQRKQVETELAENRAHLEALVATRTAEAEEVNEKLRLRLEWLFAVTRSHQAIAGMSSLALAEEELSARMSQLLGARLVFILRWDIPGMQPELVNCILQGGGDSDKNIIKECFQKDSPLRREIELGQVITLDADQAASFPGLVGECFRKYDIHLAILAPMMMRQAVFGVLGIAASISSKEFLLQQDDLVERMAFDLANLNQVATLYDQALVLAAVNERSRLARDLHDSVTQVLFSATLVADVLPQIWRRDPELGYERLEKLRLLTRGALAEMRTLLLELRPAAVINTPLNDLLVQLAEAVTSRAGLPFQLLIEQIPDLPEEVHVNFYRIAQEALNNVIKHSQAKSVTMCLSATPLMPDVNAETKCEVTLLIQDDGVGFSLGEAPSNRLGLGIMRERAAAIQADLSLKSQPGHGTQVSLTWRGEAGNNRSNS